MIRKFNLGNATKLGINMKFLGTIGIILLTINLHVSAQEAPTNNAKSSEKSSLITRSSGLQYQQIKAGNGLKPNLDDMVTIHYVFKLEDGTELDNSYVSNRPLETRVSDLIKGLQEGVQLMNQGSKFRFTIPSALAYGEDGAGGGKIPPNATIVYDIELLNIESQNNIIPENDDAPTITTAGIRDQKAKMAKAGNKKNQEDLDNVLKAQNELYETTDGLTEILALQNDFENVKSKARAFKSQYDKVSDNKVRFKMLEDLYEVYRSASANLYKARKQNTNFSNEHRTAMSKYDANYKHDMKAIDEMMIQVKKDISK